MKGSPQMGGCLMFLRDVIVSAKNNGSKRGDSGWVPNNWKLFSDSSWLRPLFRNISKTFDGLLVSMTGQLVWRQIVFFFSRAEKRSSSGQLVALPSVVPCFIALLTHKSIFSHIRKGLRAKVESVWPPDIKHSNCAWMSNLSRMKAFYQHK